MISLLIEKLFGQFTYEVKLKEDGLTIITGPNGYGKSTILRCIESLSKGLNGFNFFATLDFKRLVVRFSEDIIEIKKDEKELIINNKRINIERLNKLYNRRLPYVERLPDGRLVDYRRRMEIDVADFINELDIEIENREEYDSKKLKLVDEIKRIKELLGEVHFIKEQRMIGEIKRHRSVENKVINMIDDLPKKFRQLMSSVMSTYSTESNRLDSSYPNRLFQNEDKITVDEYKDKIIKMNERFEKLNKYDLSTIQNLDNITFKSEHAKALKIYFDDFDTKYKVYEDFIKKLDMFTGIINDRLSFKKVIISQLLGISIESKVTPGKKIDLNKLSSGEKQEILLFYQLIFETNKNVLLLIDEPEISLHIIWQKKFMDDLMEIIDYKKMTVIVATHSPQIINNRWDNQIDLGELYAEQFNKK